MWCSRWRLRTALELRQHYADKGGFNAEQIKIRLPDGRLYGQTGKLNFIDNTVSASTDTIILRGTIPNPPFNDGKVGDAPTRELVDGEFVTVLLEGVEPVELLTMPRAAVLSDQQRRLRLYRRCAEQSAADAGAAWPGHADARRGAQRPEAGDRVIVDGVQRVHPGQVVSPGPASPPVSASPASLQGGAGR